MRRKKVPGHRFSTVAWLRRPKRLATSVLVRGIVGSRLRTNRTDSIRRRPTVHPERIGRCALRRVYRQRQTACRRLQEVTRADPNRCFDRRGREQEEGNGHRATSPRDASVAWRVRQNQFGHQLRWPTFFENIEDAVSRRGERDALAIRRPHSSTFVRRFVGKAAGQ